MKIQSLVWRGAAWRTELALTFVVVIGWCALVRGELIGYWPLDEGSGTTVVDATGNGHDGELFGDTAWADGLFGGGLEFDGSNDYVEIPDDDVFRFTDIDDFTVTAWVYHDTPPGSGWRGVVTKSRDDAPWWGIWTNSTWRFGARPNNNVNGNVAQAGWTHVAIVADSVAGTRHLYEDGEETAMVNEITSYDGFGDIWFGGAKSVDEWFEGILDEVRVYDEALGDDEIQAIMEGPEMGTQLQAGDADQDLDFDQLDLVQVQIAAKYLTGQPATWGEGDWNGAPGGSPGSPPPGNALFDQIDIIAALAPGHYLTGPYAAIGKGGSSGDEQTSVGYNSITGQLWVDAPAGTQLTSINIDSAAGIFTGEPAQNLGGSFDNDADNNIFKATFGSSFGSLSFGNVAQVGLSEDAVANDLTVVGSLEGGGGLGDVDLIYIPEPTTVVLFVLGLLGMIGWRYALAKSPRTSAGTR